MLLCALSMSILLGSSVHRMRSVLIRALPRRCNLRSISPLGGTKFACAVTLALRSEALGQRNRASVLRSALSGSSHLLFVACSRPPGLRSAPPCCAAARRPLRPHQASTRWSSADQAPSLVCALSTRRTCEWYLKGLLISKWEPFAFRVFRLGKPNTESRRADSNRLPLLQLRVCLRTS